MPSLQKLKKQPGRRSKSGFTLLEIAIVLGLVVAISAGSLAVGTAYKDYEQGTQAGAVLRLVRQAQLAYLIDHPTVPIANISAADPVFLSYLPQNGAILNGISYNGIRETINVNVYPPTITFNGATPPNYVAGSTNGLWNVGAY